MVLLEESSAERRAVRSKGAASTGQCPAKVGISFITRVYKVQNIPYLYI